MATRKNFPNRIRVRQLGALRRREKFEASLQRRKSDIVRKGKKTVINKNDRTAALLEITNLKRKLGS